MQHSQRPYKTWLCVLFVIHATLLVRQRKEILIEQKDLLKKIYTVMITLKAVTPFGAPNILLYYCATYATGFPARSWIQMEQVSAHNIFIINEKFCADLHVLRGCDVNLFAPNTVGIHLVNDVHQYGFYSESIIKQ